MTQLSAKVAPSVSSPAKTNTWVMTTCLTQRHSRTLSTGTLGKMRNPTARIPGGVAYTPGQTWMKDKEIVSGTFPNISAIKLMMPCMECQNAPCMAAATGGAVYRRADRIVIIDPVKSVGQTQIVDVCPYGRVYWNSALNIPQSCTFCAHKIDAGQNPKCVDACPLSAITFGDLSNSSSAISKLVAQELQRTTQSTELSQASPTSA